VLVIGPLINLLRIDCVDCQRACLIPLCRFFFVALVFFIVYRRLDVDESPL
jgi:hypothetical protein